MVDVLTRDVEDRERTPEGRGAIASALGKRMVRDGRRA
jgi:hypothetical protein